MNQKCCVACGQLNAPQSQSCRLCGLKFTAQMNPKDSAAVDRCPLSLVPVTALAPISAVMLSGDLKYGTANWRETPIKATTYLDATLRHIGRWRDGQDLDNESGVSELAHAAATLIIMLDALACGTLIDNRPVSAPTDWVLKNLEGQIAAIRERATLHLEGADATPGADSPLS